MIELNSLRAEITDFDHFFESVKRYRQQSEARYAENRNKERREFRENNLIHIKDAFMERYSRLRDEIRAVREKILWHDHRYERYEDVQHEHVEKSGNRGEDMDDVWFGFRELIAAACALEDLYLADYAEEERVENMW